MAISIRVLLVTHIYLPKDTSLGGFLQTRTIVEKQKVNINRLTFNYFVDYYDKLSNLWEDLRKLEKIAESVEDC